MQQLFPRSTISHVTIPPELASGSALLKYLEVAPRELKKIWWFRRQMYHQFELSKDHNKTRLITAPDDRLKYLQRKIIPLLDQLYRVRNPVHGFVSRKSVRTNALAHLRKRFVLNVDLQDFFPSITEKRIIGVLESLNIEPFVAKMVARLCCCNNYLPQGAPTSPILSNMICFRLDKELLSFAKNARCIYTRYADDITLSSHQPMTGVFEGAIPPPGHFIPDLLASRLRDIITNNGFTLNPRKTHYADQHSRRMVTGLKVNELLNVDRRYVRNIRAALYSVQKLGRKAAQAKFEATYGGTFDLAAHLNGKITWLGHIRGQSDPVFRAVADRYNSTFSSQKIKVTPTSDEIRDRAVWIVEHDGDQGSQGTGFFLKDVGLITAAHCVEGVEEVEVYHPSKPANKFKATILKRDSHRDLAILKHPISSTEYFELERSTQSVNVGDELSAIGYPSFGPGDSINIRDGKVSSLAVKSAVRMIEVTQKLSPGMSGGPLLNGGKKVVGITHKGGPTESRDFAIHIDELISWYQA